MKKIIIIDGNALVHRAFHALPALSTKDGKVVNAVYGFTSILLKILKEMKPEYLALTFDVAKKTFRDDIYPEYKATRVKQPQELYDQIPIIKNLAQTMNISIYEKENFEADDVIGTLCQHPEVDKKELETNILTGDLDTLQLVNSHTKVIALKKGITDTFLYDEQAVVERFGLKPSQLIDYKALRGDQSDNIPGVKGIGEKTASELIGKFGCIERLYDELNAEKTNINGKLAKILKENEAQARLSKKLVTIVTSVPLEFHLEDCLVKPFDRNKTVELFTKLEFHSLINRLPEFSSNQNAPQGVLFKFENVKKNFHYQLVNDDESFSKFLRKIVKQKHFTFDTETSSLDCLVAKLLGISFSWKESEAFFVVINKERLQKLKIILENSKVSKSGHNMKFDYKILRMHGVDVEGMSFDTMIASCLLNPARQHNLDSLVLSEFHHEKVAFQEMYESSSLIIDKKREKFLNMNTRQGTQQAIPVEFLSLYSCEDADFTERLFKKYSPEIEKNHFVSIFQDVEMPLVPILAEMELTGIKIDAGFLIKMSRTITKKMILIDKKIYTVAGKIFNIDSPLQLKYILFNTLKIPTKGLRNVKTGISTAARELEKLRSFHPIVDYLIEHRELAKLKSTYTDALPKLIHPKTGRLHTSFNQTITATGRLSSTEPNLQNIPIRTPLGREIRKAFVTKKGYKIMSFDYSQLELRIAAHLSEDEQLIHIFNEDKDVHASTAAEIYKVSLEKVTKEMRSAAKTVNFGVLYGQGPKSLSEQTGMTFEQAKEFIQKYFSVFAGVRRFIEETKKLTHHKGYVETLSGRRRYLPDLYSGVQQIRAAAERMSVNTPIQGTEAELIKIAMIRIYNKIKDTHARMLLQVHDELVFEVKKDDVDAFAKMILHEMEHAITLRVPLKVDISVGDNWGELEKIY
jgi:DNA polymerase-1